MESCICLVLALILFIFITSYMIMNREEFIERFVKKNIEDQDLMELFTPDMEKMLEKEISSELGPSFRPDPLLTRVQA